jgi:hypothetical protein
MGAGMNSRPPVTVGPWKRPPTILSGFLAAILLVGLTIGGAWLLGALGAFVVRGFETVYGWLL